MGEDLGHIERLTDGRVVLHYPGHEPRTYKSKKGANERLFNIEHGRATSTNPVSSQPWTTHDDEVLREIWGKVTKAEYLQHLPGRTYMAIKTRARYKKLKADPSCKTRRSVQFAHCARARARMRWSDEQFEIATQNALDVAKASLRGQKTAEQIVTLIQSTLTDQKPFGLDWTDAEISLVRAIERADRTLRERYNRTPAAIRTRRERIRKIDGLLADAMKAVKAANSGLIPAVRDEVESEVLIAVLAREVSLSDLKPFVRKTVTRIYGPRHYSLDAPIGDDGGTAWIDTIESTREHF